MAGTGQLRSCFRAIGSRKQRLLFEPRRDSTVARRTSIAEGIKFESLRSQSLAATVALTAIAIDPDANQTSFLTSVESPLRAGEARGIQGSTGKWVSNVLLISITFSLVKPPPAASSEIALR